MVEIWKDIKGFENMYAVSNLGRVKSKARKVWNHNNYWIRPERILKAQVSDRGYLRIRLGHNKTKCTRRIHRLVAEAFIPNPDNLPEVNHKNEDKTKNGASNLEWCTSHDNKVYGTRRERVARKVSDPSIPRKNNTSGRKGVSKNSRGKWVAHFNRKYLGTFKTFDEAVKVREKAEKEAYNF